MFSNSNTKSKEIETKYLAQEYSLKNTKPFSINISIIIYQYKLKGIWAVRSLDF